MRFLVGLIIIAAGALVIQYRFTIYEMTGEWEWASKYLGSTMFAIILIGMILIGAGAAYPFGVFDSMTRIETPQSNSSR